ncbi:hypothetical protein MMC20_002791 [Loxospora ochrophaea]|nr:hypothetical protein [Loxospora ochrophaea]
MSSPNPFTSSQNLNSPTFSTPSPNPVAQDTGLHEDTPCPSNRLSTKGPCRVPLQGTGSPQIESNAIPPSTSENQSGSEIHGIGPSEITRRTSVAPLPSDLPRKGYFVDTSKVTQKRNYPFIIRDPTAEDEYEGSTTSTESPHLLEPVESQQGFQSRDRAQAIEQPCSSTSDRLPAILEQDEGGETLSETEDLSMRSCSLSQSTQQRNSPESLKLLPEEDLGEASSSSSEWWRPSVPAPPLLIQTLQSCGIAQETNGQEKPTPLPSASEADLHETSSPCIGRLQRFTAKNASTGIQYYKTARLSELSDVPIDIIPDESPSTSSASKPDFSLADALRRSNTMKKNQSVSAARSSRSCEPEEESQQSNEDQPSRYLLSAQDPDEQMFSNHSSGVISPEEISKPETIYVIVTKNDKSMKPCKVAFDKEENAVDYAKGFFEFDGRLNYRLLQEEYSEQDFLRYRAKCWRWEDAEGTAVVNAVVKLKLYYEKYSPPNDSGTTLDGRIDKWFSSMNVR